jgi:hypothetical protein
VCYGLDLFSHAGLKIVGDLQMELHRHPRLPCLLLRQERRRTMVSRRRPDRESSAKSKFTLADLLQKGSRGVIWEHELPLEINYVQEQAFFHTFAGDVGVDCFVNRCLG